MIDKERLEEIKNVYEDYKELQKKGDFKQADIALLYLSENHIDWLINRIEELEEEINKWKDTAYFYYMTNQALRK